MTQSVSNKSLYQAREGKDRGAAARIKHLVKFKKRSLAKTFKIRAFGCLRYSLQRVK